MVSVFYLFFMKKKVTATVYSITYGFLLLPSPLLNMTLEGRRKTGRKLCVSLRPLALEFSTEPTPAEPE